MSEAFQQAVKTWQEIRFSTLQKTLDEQGSKISDNQDECAANRKQLSVKTKEFKRLEESEKLDYIKPLLKLYQTEIDNLTNRSKYTESCFMNVYKLLGDAPDPLPLLEASIDSVKQTSELATLRRKNAELTEKLGKYHDYEKVKAKLVDVEMKQAELIASKVKAKEQEVSAIWDEKESTWKATEEELRSELGELRGNYQIAQARLTSQATSDPTETSLKIAELNTTARELEKQTLRVAQLESRNLELRKEIEGVKSGSKAQEIKDDYESRLSQLENDNAVLSARHEASRDRSKQKDKDHAAAVANFESSVAAMKQELAAAETTLAKQQDYDQIKAELQLLRSIEFGNEEMSTGSGQPGSSQPSEFVQVLEVKNAKLNEDLASLRVKNQKYSNENAALLQSIRMLEDQLAKNRQLVSTLENDLSTMQQHDNDTFSTISGWTAVPRRISPASSIAAGRAPSIRGGSAGSASSHVAALGQPGPVAGEAVGVDPSVLNIVTQQRDRFKERVIQLEEEQHTANGVAKALKEELAALKQQNVELYERSRYMQSQSSKKGVYDESVSDFQLFKSLETERAFSNMAPHDRVMQGILRNAVVNAKFRYILFSVVLGEQVLLFFLLIAHSTS